MVAKPVKVRHLRFGDRFIWADENTRDFMCVDETPAARGVLRCRKVCTDYVRFEYPDGEVGLLYFHDEHLVYVLDHAPDHRTFPVDMPCLCGSRWGAHRGMSCPGRVGTFEPDQFLAEPQGEDFFAELGL